MSTQLEFEWDDNKNLANTKKHRISFETAIFVFQDPNRLEIFDEKHSQDEERYLTIGVIDKILTVVHTYRSSKIRIISARLATKEEKEMYYNGY